MEVINLDSLAEALQIDANILAMGGVVVPKELIVQIEDAFSLVGTDTIPMTVPTLELADTSGIYSECYVDLTAFYNAVSSPISSEAAEHNILDGTRQREVQVEPKRQMVLVEVGDDELVVDSKTGIPKRTSLFSFLSHVSIGEYPIPYTGYWKEHDLETHVETVSDMHTDLATLVMQVAQLGLDYLSEGKVSLAEGRASFLDLYMQPELVADQQTITSLVKLAHLGIDEGKAEKQAEILARTQASHQEVSRSQKSNADPTPISAHSNTLENRYSLN